MTKTAPWKSYCKACAVVIVPGEDVEVAAIGLIHACCVGRRDDRYRPDWAMARRETLADPDVASRLRDSRRKPTSTGKPLPRRRRGI